MIFSMKCFKKRWFLISLIWMIGVLPASAVGMDIIPNYSFDLQIITEGMDNYPIDKQLSSFIPFDIDITLIVAIGWTGDKLTIELTDEESYGDRLTAIAIAFYQNQVRPFWGTVYSSSSQDTFDITIPVTPPGIIVLLASGYFFPSKGENQYKYNITLSFPQ